MEEKKKKSAFNLVAKILIVLLVVAIVVQICVFVYFKIKIDQTKKKNSQIPETSQSEMIENLDKPQDFFKKIDVNKI